jgi:hypothetical protein
MTDFPLTIRRATAADLPDIVRLMADDVLGQARFRSPTSMRLPRWTRTLAMN